MAPAPRKVPRTAAEVTKSLWCRFITVSCPFRLEISQHATKAKIAEPGRLTGEVTGRVRSRPGSGMVNRPCGGQPAGLVMAPPPAPCPLCHYRRQARP
jgi:hypothetical protein